VKLRTRVGGRGGRGERVWLGLSYWCVYGRGWWLITVVA